MKNRKFLESSDDSGNVQFPFADSDIATRSEDASSSTHTEMCGQITHSLHRLARKYPDRLRNARTAGHVVEPLGVRVAMG